ncbi:hypothetical protein PVAP13_1KG197820 [Panicum virgatum]|uniref:Uncharacterized protein n=1 Tax=Panicum virgatum TaxID=38727 RepID=A0A8T0X7T2_PANVG|nr:hypothetical protein PVAP13_1KG197820 [Panicum virgatum]
MLPVGVNSISLLRAVSRQYCLPYTSLITKVGDDGTLLCGVELELPQLELVTPHRYFFWSPAEQSLILAYERSAMQAVAFLQGVYRFSLADTGVSWPLHLPFQI